MFFLSVVLLACLFGLGLRGNAVSGVAAAPAAAAVVVDDFEDGDLSAPGGSWYKISDSIAGGSSRAEAQVVAGGAGGSKRSMRLSGALTNDFKFGPFAGVGVKIAGGPRDLSGSTGIRFYARGDGGKYRISVPCAAVRDHNEFGKDITPGAAWRLYSIPFAQLAQQPGWGRPVQWSGRDVKGFELVAMGAARGFNVQIDQVSFY
jgi:hypothetical protein